MRAADASRTLNLTDPIYKHSISRGAGEASGQSAPDAAAALADCRTHWRFCKDCKRDTSICHYVFTIRTLLERLSQCDKRNASRLFERAVRFFVGPGAGAGIGTGVPFPVVIYQIREPPQP